MGPDRESPGYLARNQRLWTSNAPDYLERGRRNWAGEPSWGIWDVPESRVGLVGNVVGKDVLELGCGTGYVSGWLARRGARPIGLDPTSAQILNAKLLQEEFAVGYPLVLAAAENLPFVDRSFDLVISEYGASIWSDPYLWVPEASRVLRPGGELVFLVNGTLLMLCSPDSEDVPAGDRLLRDYFGMHAISWPDDDSVEFHLGYGDWIRLLRRNGFEVRDLIELRPEPDAESRYPFITPEWARRWPSEQVWMAAKSH